MASEYFKNERWLNHGIEAEKNIQYALSNLRRRFAELLSFCQSLKSAEEQREIILRLDKVKTFLRNLIQGRNPRDQHSWESIKPSYSVSSTVIQPEGSPELQYVRAESSHALSNLSFLDKYDSIESAEKAFFEAAGARRAAVDVRGASPHSKENADGEAPEIKSSISRPVEAAAGTVTNGDTANITPHLQTDEIYTSDFDFTEKAALRRARADDARSNTQRDTTTWPAVAKCTNLKVRDIFVGAILKMDQLTHTSCEIFECNKYREDSLQCTFNNNEHFHQILVDDDVIACVKVEDHNLISHKWTRDIIDIFQVYLVVKDSGITHQLALEFVQRHNEVKPHIEVMLFSPESSKRFTRLVSTRREVLLKTRSGTVSNSECLHTSTAGDGWQEYLPSGSLPDWFLQTQTSSGTLVGTQVNDVPPVSKRSGVVSLEKERVMVNVMQHSLMEVSSARLKREATDGMMIPPMTLQNNVDEGIGAAVAFKKLQISNTSRQHGHQDQRSQPHEVSHAAADPSISSRLVDCTPTVDKSEKNGLIAGNPYEVARIHFHKRVHLHLPKMHIPRPGLTELQRTLGPLPGDFCRPKFCSARCVASSCAAFIRVAGHNISVDLDLHDTDVIKRHLRKIVIRNHPDKNSVERVGEVASANATVLVQQATFLESMLAESEYVALSVHVDIRLLPPEGIRTSGNLPSDEIVFLSRVYLGLTLEQLIDIITVERQELASYKAKMQVSMLRTPGEPEMRMCFGTGKTLRDLNVDSKSLFRIRVSTKAESKLDFFTNLSGKNSYEGNC